MLQLTLLGSPSATLDAALLTDKLLNKELALLYYMAAEGQQNAMPSRNLGGHLNEHLDEHLDGLRQSRAALAVLFWGDHPEAAAHASLRKALSNLRQLLGGHIVITRSEVMLVRKQCTVDLWEFERLATIGLSACEPAQLQAAAALYRGSFLAGFGVHAAVDFEDWTRTQQERLRGLEVQILTVMAAACAAQGDGSQAIAAQRRILECEPWRE